jgi:hypothetical protein
MIIAMGYFHIGVLLYVSGLGVWVICTFKSMP